MHVSRDPVAAGALVKRAKRKRTPAAAASSSTTLPTSAAPALAGGETLQAGHTWLRWSAFVQRRPWTIAIASTLTMLLIAAPAIALRLGSSDASNDPSNQTTHRAYELLAQGFGEGFNGPLLVVAKVPNPSREAAQQGTVVASSPAGPNASVEKLRAAIAATPGVVSVAPAKFNPAGEVATITVYPHSSPQAYATTQLVHALRDGAIPPVKAQTGMTVYVGGVTAGAVDFAAVLGQKLPLFIGVVVLLSRAAADDRVPLAGDPAAGRGHEPAQHRRRARRDRDDLPVGLAGRACSASSRARSSRSSR